MAGSDLDAMLAQLGPEPASGGPSMGAPGPGPAESLDAMLAKLGAGGGGVQTQNAGPTPSPAPDKYAIEHAGPEGDQRSSGIGPVDSLKNFLGGFYNKIADTIGLPVEMVNEAMGYAGKAFLDKPGNAQAAVRYGFAKAGLGTYQGAADSIAGMLGEETVTQLLTVAGMRAAAPAMASLPGVPQGGNAVQSAARTMGEGLIEKPMTTAVIAASAAPGTVGGRAVGGPVGEGIAEALGAEPGGRTSQMSGALGRTIGEILGGTATGVVGVKALGRTLPENERLGAVPSRPIVDRNAAPDASRQVAEQQVNRAMQIIEDRATRELQRIAPAATTAEEASIAFADKFTKAEQAARKVEENLWRQVPNRGPADEAAIVKLDGQATRVLNTHEMAPDQAPTKALSNFRRIVRERLGDGTEENPGNGRPVTLNDLKTLRSGLMDAYANNRTVPLAGKVESRALSRQILRFVDNIDDAVEASIEPAAQQALLTARAASRRINELFTKGPANMLRAQSSTGTPALDAGAEVPALLDKRYGGNAVYNATQPIPGIPPGTRGTIDLRATQQQAEKGFDVGVRAYFRDKVLEAGDPNNPIVNPGQRLNAMAKTAGDMSKKLDKRIDDFARAGTQIKDQAVKLQEAVVARREWEKSAALEYSGKTPDVSAKRILNGADPAAEARDVMGVLRRRPVTGASPAVSSEAAVSGIQKAFVEELLTADTAASFAQRLQDPRVMGAMRVVFANEPGAIERLQNVAAAAVAVESGQHISATSKLGRLLFGGAGALLGLHFGHLYAGVLAGGVGAGTLSYPGQFRRMMRSFAMGLFADKEPKAMLAQAVVDPRAEKVLTTQLPTTAAAGRTYARHLAATASAVQSAHRDAVNRYSKEMERDK